MLYLSQRKQEVIDLIRYLLIRFANRGTPLELHKKFEILGKLIGQTLRSYWNLAFFFKRPERKTHGGTRI